MITPPYHHGTLPVVVIQEVTMKGIYIAETNILIAMNLTIQMRDEE